MRYWLSMGLGGKPRFGMSWTSRLAPAHTRDDAPAGEGSATAPASGGLLGKVILWVVLGFAAYGFIQTVNPSSTCPAPTWSSD